MLFQNVFDVKIKTLKKKQTNSLTNDILYENVIYTLYTIRKLIIELEKWYLQYIIQFLP